MIRVCDGRDTHLTRAVPSPDFDTNTMTISVWHRAEANPGQVVINCQCGLRFDDVTRMTIYPHTEIAPPILLRYP